MSDLCVLSARCCSSASASASATVSTQHQHQQHNNNANTTTTTTTTVSFKYRFVVLSAISRASQLNCRACVRLCRSFL